MFFLRRGGKCTKENINLEWAGMLVTVSTSGESVKSMFVSVCVCVFMKVESCQ